MSVTQKNLPIATRTSVIDHLFKCKYNLTYSETIVMSYILLLSSWATKVEEDYYLLLSSKIEQDLPLGAKTIEATFTKLKKLELIETKLTTIKKWSLTQKYRSIRATNLGKEYNLRYHKPEEYQYINLMKEQLEEVEAKNEFLEQKQAKIEEENIILTLQVRGRDLCLESNEKMTEKAQEILNKEIDLKNQI